MARVGIIGTGWGLRSQAPAFQAAGLEVTAIAGRNHEKTKRAAAELGGTRACADWREIAEADDIDLVSIVTPPDLHLEMTVAALENGKHVLCEKPMALDIGQTKSMIEAAAKFPDRITIIDHELRFLPSHTEARKRVRELGPIRYAEARYSSPGRANPDRPWNWWSDRESGGGIWGAVGSHLVDALRTLIGEISAAQGSLSTVVGARPHEGGSREVTSDDLAEVNLRFESGASASLFMSVVAGVDEPTTITVHGERGSLRLVAEKLFVSTNKEWTEVPLPSGQKISGDTAGGWFGSGTFHLGHALVSALDEDDPSHLESVAATFSDGHAVQGVLDAARASHDRGGAWQNLDPSR